MSSAVTKLGIKLIREGCANRPFYLIAVTPQIRNSEEIKEQIGTYDPLPNERNEKLCAINLERLYYWIGQGAKISTPLRELLGLGGFLPIHPRTYMTAWRNRKTMLETQKKETKTDEN
ncbi:probable 28S ribosomal protein S16, mitochondrial [Centruroides sculpturatus]|uniref:probable 28S ribosomal protein S16, mitochondrial n=1 Tax=Centruroides sculpturatus TaxID=218467 RepID=UPI000C6CD2A5|nr:probable 28S ribosomal protein S16, mitochondrial [Centruroides sculpturatus]